MPHIVGRVMLANSSSMKRTMRAAAGLPTGLVLAGKLQLMRKKRSCIELMKNRNNRRLRSKKQELATKAQLTTNISSQIQTVRLVNL